MLSVKQLTIKKEEAFLSPFAVKSSESKGRLREEQPCPMRTDFQRDRDRIIYSRAFIRLKNKTQVFFSPEGDHYMTRLTHTLDVSQIARSISRALALNEDLTEAIALGHDLGHTPFGHAGERVLSKLSPNGFKHNEQSLRVVDVLENGGQGLNLTEEVRDGILNHKTGTSPKTLEGQVVSISDRIAYLNHDVDDAIRAGIIKADGLPYSVLKYLGKTSRERINVMINSAYENSLNKPVISLSPDVDGAMKELRAFMFDKVYMMPTAKKEEERAGYMISSMYGYFKENPSKLPENYLELLKKYPLETVICDYLSSMTDRYAISTFTQIFIPQSF
ncbi:MAG: deoxyguanosinetriphosphate triphosphohydrolase [Clostridia bacterium]|nr:deoxyguanosinetriphosphate triphosphohydrolase [Clostridia bacterium]